MHTQSNLARISMHIEYDIITIDPSHHLEPDIHPPVAVHAYEYPYTDDLLQLDSFCNPIQIQLPVEARKITTPLRAAMWQALLQDHPDRRFVQCIVAGITQGFRIGFRRDHTCRKAAGNMRSAILNPQPVSDFIETEVLANRISGPLQGTPQVHVSRFGVIPKQGQPGQWRLILDLSNPQDHSINDGIARELCSMKYATVDNDVQRILQRGRGTLLAKIDIEHAYRNIPIHPGDRHLLGMSWNGALFIDTALPFGLRSAPKKISAVANALEWVALHKGVSVVLHYLDDYLTIGRKQCVECRLNLQILCHQLGVPLKWQKLEGPTTSLVFLGILLDTEKMEMRLHEGKVDELKRLIAYWMARRSGKKRELLSLVGKLSHAAKIVVPGHIFLIHMIDTAHRVKHLDHSIHLNQDFKSDLAWWQAFMQTWNGLGMTQCVATEWTPSITFATDASGGWGCGTCWEERWI